MKDCQKCFWLTQHKLWKRPNGIFPSLPSGMDRIIKQYFNSYRERNELPPELVGLGSLQLFNKEILTEWQNNFNGIRHTNSEGDVLFGAVDDILINQNKLVVIDFKTRGYEARESTLQYYKTQLEIYSFLLRKNGYQTEYYAFLMFFVPNSLLPNGEVKFDISLKKVNIYPENTEILWKKALKILKGEKPHTSCQWCETR